MNIGLAYSYLNGEQEHSRALKPWLPHVDYIIALDGRYRTPLTPAMRRKNLPNYSTDNSFEVLEKLCGHKFIYDKLFASQIDKRNRTFEIAGELGCDIVIVWDTDDIIHPDYQDWNKFFKQIEVMVEHFPEEYTYKMYCWIPSVKDWSPQHNEVPPETWIKYDRVHRPKNLRYTHTHYNWCLKDVTDKEIDEWRWSHSDRLENPYYKQGNTILDGIRFTTNRALRTREQLIFGDGWAWQNQHWEAYEFDTKAYYVNKNLVLAYEELKATKYPNLEYYFPLPDEKGRVFLTPYYEKDGQFIRIKPDMTEEILT